MNFCGIVCEFNPFHNGHEYLIDQIKEKLCCDIVCIMSGDFVQRGAPSIECKYERAQKAIAAGADMVVELPCIYACSNAENFAYGAVKTLAALGVTHLAFGIEETNIETLKKIADLKIANSQDFQNAFKNEIQNGINYNTALKRAISASFEDREHISQILNKPNNILAIEYLCAIKRLNLKIEILVINRIDNGFVSNISQGKFLSATAIRKKINEDEDVSKFIPKYAQIKDYFSKSQFEIFEKLVLHKIRTSNPKELEKFYDYEEGIEYRIKEKTDNFSTLEQIIENVATPRYRKPRVAKLLLYPLLGITKKIESIAKTTKPAAKLLSIKKEKKYLLSKIKKSKINLIVTNNDYKLLNKNQSLIINIDQTASNIYGLVTSQIHNKDKKIGVIFK